MVTLVAYSQKLTGDMHTDKINHKHMQQMSKQILYVISLVYALSQCTVSAYTHIVCMFA